MAAQTNKAIQVLAEQRETEVAQGYAFEQQGLRVLRDLTQAEWEGALRLAADYAERGTWAIGDLLVYGFRRGDWGAFYDRAMDLTGLEYHTLSNKTCVSRAFPFETRVPRMSWSSHQAVLSLPESKRREALLKAREERWGWRRLSTWVKSQAQQPSVKGAQNRHPRPTAMRQVRCPNCQHEWHPTPKDWVWVRRPRLAKATSR